MTTTAGDMGSVGSIKTFTSDVPRPMSRVEGALDDLAAEVQRVEDRIGSLGGRLTGVLGPADPPADPGPTEGARSVSPVVSRLASLTDRLRVCSRDLAALEERLEV